VVLTSDHGELFGEGGRLGHGVSLHNKVLHVPLAFRWPGVVVRGGISQKVGLVDVMPTLLEMVGESVPRGLDGRSLEPLLLGKGPIPERPAFSELIFDPAACPGKRRECRVDRFSVQTERFKLVTSQRPEYERLYDLKADPAEEVDVSADHPAQMRRHREYLEAYLSGREAPEAAERKTILQGIEIDPETQRLSKEPAYME
jgi:arylsulfatase A-like enzyme